jgi:hypothetical protein
MACQKIIQGAAVRDIIERLNRDLEETAGSTDNSA